MKPGTALPSSRIYALDVVRGFDMFWIMGGEQIFVGLASLTGWPVARWWAAQLEHVPWHGFHFYDMIFPLFLFIAGISFPLSFEKKTAAGVTRQAIHRDIIRRGVILVLLGFVYSNRYKFDVMHLRYASVLGRIGLAWMFAALIFVNTTLRSRIALFWAIIIGYWLLMVAFPAHDLGSTDMFSREGNLASHIDRLIMPGRLFNGNHDPEGLLGTLPAISTALLGMFTGEFLRSPRLQDQPLRKVGVMLAAAIGLIAIGLLWDLVFPINKNLWSSSFVCFVGGLSLLLFALTYLVTDVWNFRQWAFGFLVIGVNPITIYMAERIVNFRSISKFLFGWMIALAPAPWTPMLNGIGLTTVAWVFLYVLYRRKIFLRVY